MCYPINIKIKSMRYAVNVKIHFEVLRNAAQCTFVVPVYVAEL